MLHERNYMFSTNSIFKRSICDFLIIVLIICFIIQSLLGLVLQESFVHKYLTFSLANLKSGYLWTIVSYGFFHDGPIHLIMNLLGLHFIGRPIEERLGSLHFKIFILVCLFAGVSFWGACNFTSTTSLIGFSAAILGCLCFFCLERPNSPITLLLFFVLPITIKPKWLLTAVVFLEIYGFLYSEYQGFGGIAHSAHIGGLLCGCLYYLQYNEKFKIPIKVTFRGKDNRSSTLRKNNSSVRTNFKVNFGIPSSIKDETDRILDKINEQGFGSLTAEEKETLEKAKKLLEK